MIVGLGNPGDRYALTRHNVGCRVLEKAAMHWSVLLRSVAGARRGAGCIGPVAVTLATPLTWMNQTGPAVKALLEELGLTPADLVVVHDDLDLEPGRLRVKRKGGAGGHNGILSILTVLGTDEFCRLKIGIGRPAPGQDAAEYVLSPFALEEAECVDASLERAVQALECLVTEGIEMAMNRFNVRKQQEGDE